jgi:hypothetical protein
MKNFKLWKKNAEDDSFYMLPGVVVSALKQKIKKSFLITYLDTLQK